MRTASASRWGSRSPLLLAAACIAYLLLVWRLDFVCDDAYISFRYVKNLASGAGLCFNPGSAAPVEGYSNTLWILLLLPFEARGLDIGLAARVMSVSSGLILLFHLSRFLLLRLALPAVHASIAVLWLALLPAFAAWSTGGLATMPFALLLFVAYERLLGDHSRPRPVSAALAGLAAMLMRVDGLGWVLVLFGFGWVWGRLTRTAELRRASLVGLGVVLFGFALLSAWRLAYFDSWLPNTVHAKVGFTGAQLVRGVHYVARFFAVFPAVLLIVAIAPVGIARWRDAARVGAACLVAATFAQAVLTGGDFMAMFRFLVPAFPFLAILLASSSAELWPRAGLARAAIGLVVAANLALAPLAAFGFEPARTLARRVADPGGSTGAAFTQLQALVGQRDSCRYFTRVGRALAQHTRPGQMLVARAIGAVGYFSGLYILDQHGLVSRVVVRAEQNRARKGGAGHDFHASIAFFEPLAPDFAYASIPRREMLELPDIVCKAIFELPADETMKRVYRPRLIPIGRRADGSEEYLLLAERDPQPDGSDHGWCQALRP